MFPHCFLPGASRCPSLRPSLFAPSSVSSTPALHIQRAPRAARTVLALCARHGPSLPAAKMSARPPLIPAIPPSSQPRDTPCAEEVPDDVGSMPESESKTVPRKKTAAGDNPIGRMPLQSEAGCVSCALVVDEALGGGGGRTSTLQSHPCRGARHISTGMQASFGLATGGRIHCIVLCIAPSEVLPAQVARLSGSSSKPSAISAGPVGMCECVRGPQASDQFGFRWLCSALSCQP